MARGSWWRTNNMGVRYRLKAVNTGRFRLDGGAMFGVVPKMLWQDSNPADENNRISMHMRALYAEGGGRRLIIDSGAGTKLDEKMKRNYQIESKPFREVLSSQDIDPDSITDAVITHLHFDHAGGFTYYAGGGKTALSLPEAKHYLQRKQWEAAINPNEKDRASFFPENFLPLRERERLELLDGEREIMPGVTVIPTQGHTPGHQVVVLDTGGHKWLYCGDLVPLASHVNLPYIMAYDHFPLQTLEEKKRLLSRAVDENWILFFEHDPEIAAARIKRNDKGRFEISEKVNI
ncbi:MAG: MBL fold metallo-hydrolase [Candidatus Krumholzibacteriota bacterium]|nr:MBL fold metallo-hydrolase [Candidatus Krumholzibacteriota bacterium]